jgi:hypothetical protein
MPVIGGARTEHAFALSNHRSVMRPADGQSCPLSTSGLREPEPDLILAVGEPMWEPNDEESGEVLNALCRHEPSSVTRRDSSRPPRSVTRFNLGAGGRRFESGHPDQKRRSQITLSAARMTSKIVDGHLWPSCRLRVCVSDHLPGRAGLRPPRASMAKPIRGVGLWNPKAIRVMTLILVFTDSMRPLLRPCSRVAWMLGR